MKPGRKPAAYGTRFWDRVQKGAPDDCWLWQGAYANKGKGHGQVTYLGKTYPAHRVAFHLHNGREAQGLVRHTCNTRGCCNPAHLIEGSHEDNLHDRIGTPTDPTSADPECREIIREMLEAGVSIGKLSRVLGLNHKAIVNIRDRVGLYKDDPPPGT